MTFRRLRNALRVAQKELRSSLRDRQTVLYTFVLPLAMYPVLFWIMIQSYTVVRGRDAAREVRVAVLGEPRGTTLEDVREALEEPLEPDGLREAGPLVVELGDGPPTEEEAQRLLEERQGEALADAVLLFPPEAGGSLLLHEGTRSASVLAKRRTEERLELLATATRRAAVEAAGGDFATLAPFALRDVDLASEQDLGGHILSFILPLTFVIMALLGAFFPAVDLTAGEKERGNAETTMLLPVARADVHLGKVLTVAVTALIATTLNLVGMAVAAEHLLASLPGRPVTIEIPWLSLLAVTPIALAYLFSTSALLLTAASFTKTFKQGQSLLGAVQVLFIVPAMVGIMPGVDLTLGLALVPVIQTVLAIKAILSPGGGTDTLLLLSVVLVSQMIYALVAIAVSARLTSRESLSLGGVRLRRVLGLFRSEGAPE